MVPARIMVAMAPGRAAQPALDKALLLARGFESSLELFACVFDEDLEGSHFLETAHLRAAREHRLEAASTWLEDRAAALRADGLEVRARAVYEHPRDESLVRWAAETQADLLVVGTHDHSWAERCLLGATEWQLIRTCPCPLLLARDLPWAAPPKVLAAVDPGHRDDEHAVLDQQILAAAAALARAGADVEVAHCLVSAQDILAAAAAGAVPPYADIGIEEATRDVIRQRRERVQALAREAGLDNSRLHLREGRAVDELPALVAETGADLLILGGVSRSRLAQVFIGGTAERLLDRAGCDLLVMRTPGAGAVPAGG